MGPTASQESLREVPEMEWGERAVTPSGNSGDSRSIWWWLQSWERLGTVLSRRWQGRGREEKEECFWGQLSPPQIISGKPQSVSYVLRPRGLWDARGCSKTREERAGNIRSEWAIHRGGSQNCEQERISGFPAKTLNAYKSIRWARMPLD